VQSFESDGLEVENGVLSTFTPILVFCSFATLKICCINLRNSKTKLLQIALIFALAILMHQKFDLDKEDVTYLKVIIPFALFLLVSSFSYFFDAFWGYDLRKKYLFGTEGRLRKGVIAFEFSCTIMYFCFLLSTFSLMDDLHD